VISWNNILAFHEKTLTLHHNLSHLLLYGKNHSNCQSERRRGQDNDYNQSCSIACIIDADPQANATSGYGIDPRNLSSSIYECMVDSYPVDGSEVPTCMDGLFIVGSSINLAGAEIELISKPDRERVLERLLTPVKDKYDFMLIDCSPSLGLITVNALTAADSVIIPVQAEYFALEGISKLLNTIRIIKSRLNPALQIEGFLLTMYDARLRLANQIYEELKGHFAEMVFDTVIPRNIRLSEAPSHGLPALLYDAESRGATSHVLLAKELIAKNRKSLKRAS